MKCAGTSWQGHTHLQHSGMRGGSRYCLNPERCHRGTPGAAGRRSARDVAGGRRGSGSVCASAPGSSLDRRAQQEELASRQPVVMGRYDLSSVLSLGNIRQTLVRLGDTILFALLERAQFAENEVAYMRDGVEVPDFTPCGRRYSLLEYYLREMEQVQGRIRRYTSPDEHAFFPDHLPPLVLPPLTYQKVLAPCADDINYNERIMGMYLHDLLPEIAKPGDDGNYGSAVMYDVMILQAVSRRIHYGKFVAEIKFREHTDLFTDLIRRQDSVGLMAAITDSAVEARNIERVKLRAATFGQDMEDMLAVVAHGGRSRATAEAPSPTYAIDPDVVADLYLDSIMPLTKEVEVEYLLRRLE